MREPEAQAVLLVRAFEEADADGRLLLAAQRVEASAQARQAEGGRDERLLVARAELLLPTLELAVPGLRRLLPAARVGAGLGVGVAALALVVGLLSNALGPTQRIQILFAPMLGLVAWNVAVYVALLVLGLRGLVGAPDVGGAPAVAGGTSRGAGGSGVASAARAARGLAGRLAGWIVERSVSRRSARQVADQGLVAAALGRFARAWRAASGALMACRLRRLLHLGAAALVLGTIAGMYVRGLGLRYGATWESTFLDAHQVQALVDVVLGPAAAVLGVAVPAVAPLEQTPGHAAPWIHLWAATGALVVIVPRCLLALWELLRERRLRAAVALDLGEAYYRRLLAAGAGRSRHVLVLPYSSHLQPRARDGLLALLADVFGTRADVRVAEPLDYGTEPEQALAAAAADDAQRQDVVLLLPLAQPPETEVHGRFVEGLRRLLEARGAASLRVLVDASTYRERLPFAADRLDERRRAWERVLRESGAATVCVDLSRPVPDEVVTALSGAAVAAGGAA